MEKLRDKHGKWASWDNGLQGLMRDYFTTIYKTTGSESNKIISLVKPRVSESQNMQLLKPFEAHEVKDALFSMRQDKTSGLDGFNPGFYQNH